MAVFEWWEKKGRKYFLKGTGALLGVLTFITSSASFGKIPTFIVSNDLQKGTLSDYGWIAISFILCFYLYNLILDVNKQKLISHLQGEIGELKIENKRLEEENQEKIEAIEKYAKGFAVSLAESLEFENTDRVTVYSHEDDLEDDQGAFVPVVRYSQDPVYNSKGRGVYAGEEGCISRTWRNEKWFAADRPDADEDAFPDEEDEFVQRCVSQGMDPDEARGLSMKSRLYYGRVITGELDADQIAVVIIESTDPERWSLDELDQVFEAREINLSEFVNRIEPIMPDISATSNKGF